ncbi:MAG: PKD domain-containing protein [Bacteroidetes bacterium]|nr:PKD domain-containing protein [Bacteroidota bacterium]
MKKFYSTFSKCVFAFIFILLNSNSILAQSIANYTTTRTTSIVYSSIASTGNAIDSWRNNVSFTQDDNRSNPVDIGFDFWYNGTRYTQFSVSTNGFVDFSSSTADGGPSAGPYSYDNTQFTGNGAGTWLAIAPFYDDMTAQGGVDALGNSIKYLVSGTAPNRVLTVEWINMAVYLNTTPSINFQVKLYETTGVIEFIYGTMTQGTNAFTYTCGINAATLNNAPTAAQLKCQQTANSNTFNNGQQNGLTTLPANNSMIRFSPPVTTPSPSGALSFTGVSQTGMTVNWTNWCTNEVGYVVYSSTDNVNFSFVGQTATNTTNYAVTGLLPGTLYYWRLYAVTDGFLSAAISGQQSTNAAGNKFSTGSGNWNTAGSWTPAGVPTASDNVTIRNGHTITVNTDAFCNTLTVGEGTSGILRVGNNNTVRNITVNSNITINAGATFDVTTGSNATHLLTLKGNLTNNGTLNFATDGNSLCNITFSKNGNVTYSGTGATNNFNLVALNLGTSISNTLDIITPSFTAPSNFLTLTNGVFKLSTTGTTNLTPFTALALINNTSGINVNSATATVNFPAGISLYGNLIVNNGAVNIGDAVNENVASNGGVFQIFGGTVRVAGQYYSVNINNLAKFTISGGTLTLPTVGCTSTSIAPFHINGVGSTFNMTGGTIIIERSGGANLGYTAIGITNSSVTGGTLQIGNASTPLAQTMNINSSARVGNLLVNSTNATAILNTNSLTVTNNITINSGVLNANNLNFTLGGNWLDAGAFTPGTGTVIFNGTNQSITKAAGETFNNLTLAGSATKTLGGILTTNGNLTINSGVTLDVSASDFTLNVKRNWVNNGTFNARNGTVFFNGTVAQTVGGSASATFRNITTSNTAGVSLLTAQNLSGTLTASIGTFALGTVGLTLLSDASGTARIATIPAAADVTGNITMQRYIPAGTDGWMFIATPVSGATLQQWDDDFITGGFTGSQYPPPTVTNASIVSYDETLSGIYDDGYVEPTNITNPITANKGYWAYIMNAPVTIDVTGTLLKKNISIPVTYTDDPAQPASEDGWNLIANPYPSTIDWNAAGWTKTNIANAVYTYSPTLDQYTSYVGGIGTNGGSNLIASSQAFLVQATGPSPVLQITETVKNASDGLFIRSNQQMITDYLLKLDLGGAGYTDETVIRFNENATTNFDLGLDANKFYSFNTDVPGISSIQDTFNLSINSLPLLTNDLQIPIMVKVGITGSYTISLDSLTNMPTSACLILTDLLNGNQIDLRTTPSYTFSIPSSTTTPRFMLNIGKPIGLLAQAPQCSGLSNGNVIATGLGIGPWNYTWQNDQGQVVQSHSNVIGSDTLQNIPAGEYTVIVGGNTGLCGGLMTETILVEEPSAINIQASVISSSCSGVSDGAILLQSSTTDLASSTFVWSNGVNVVNNENIPAGNYSLTITDSAGCSASFNYVISDSSIVDALFTMSTDTLFLDENSTVAFSNYSSGATNFEWDFGDGSAIETAVNPIHTYLNDGLYSVQLTVSNGACSDTITQNLYVLNTTGINSPDFNESIQIVADNNVYQIVFNFSDPIPVRVSLFNALGQQVLNEVQKVVQNERLSFNLSELSSGVYYFNILTDEQGMKTVKKIIKN